MRTEASNRPTTDQPQVLSVFQLTTLIQGLLETAFDDVWISGEISEVSRPHSGHIYFTLKDEQAQIRGVIWRMAASRLKFELQEGQQVICRGGLDVYPPRGSYQLVVRHVEPQGLGALQLALKQLQQKLAAEGLFEPERKRPLPSFPRRIGFVTSPTGAAIRDFLQVAARRFHGVQVFVIPAKVQGEGAAAEITRGIELANQLAMPLDLLVVGRGGGSLEDLWSFNEERVVRAIAASQIPVVSAVGHEIDVTLSDLVADVRALTPSEAAERVIPSAEELRSRLLSLQRRLAQNLRRRTLLSRQRLNAVEQRRVLRRPFDLVHDRQRRLDEFSQQLTCSMQESLVRRREQLRSLAAHLDALSPLAVLGRGYSLTQTEAGLLVREASAVTPGDLIVTRLAQGRVTSSVTSVDNMESK
jgi:exodeoxyribonuclease VII large subunit